MKQHKIIRKTKILFWKVSKSRDSELKIAWGAAIGTFISVFPTFGFGTLLVLLLSRFFKFNLLIALTTSVISNPLTSPFFLLVSYKTGSFLLGKYIQFSLDNWQSNLRETGVTILIGSLIVSGTMAVLAFYVSLFFVKKHRKSTKKNSC
jgi:uncharacterized protein (DUF2062 family)